MYNVAPETSTEDHLRTLTRTMARVKHNGETIWKGQGDEDTYLRTMGTRTMARVKVSGKDKGPI